MNLHAAKVIGLNERITVQEGNVHHQERVATISSSNDNEGITIDRCYQCILCPPMFFQSKKKGLWKRLWRSRVNNTTTNQPSGSLDHENHSNGRRVGDVVDDTLFGNCLNSRVGGGSGHNDFDYQLFRDLVDKLKERQLETLCQAVESTTGKDGPTDCVLVPRASITKVEPQVIACRIWKWPELTCAEDLKRIPSCPNEKDPVYACCNPTHWSRLCRPGNLILFL